MRYSSAYTPGRHVPSDSAAAEHVVVCRSPFSCTTVLAIPTDTLTSSDISTSAPSGPTATAAAPHVPASASDAHGSSDRGPDRPYSTNRVWLAGMLGAAAAAVKLINAGGISTSAGTPACGAPIWVSNPMFASASHVRSWQWLPHRWGRSGEHGLTMVMVRDALPHAPARSYTAKVSTYVEPIVLALDVSMPQARMSFSATRWPLQPNSRQPRGGHSSTAS
mmetsp:Transcript_8258/g.24927  ORF Transcript_8258/g.24927 Transcript_8258/m.24927 type:complete len:221 (+) Transcript_8258:8307-8969(+)